MSIKQKIGIIIFLLIITVLTYFCVLRPPSAIPSSDDTTGSQLPSITSFNEAHKADLIRNVQITIRAKNSKAVYEQIRSIATQNNAVISRADVNTSNDEYSGIISLSIADDKVAGVINGLDQIHGRIESENTTVTNIAQQRIDLNAQLSAALSLESQYLQILKTTQSVEDVVAVTDRLTSIRQNIEDLKRSSDQLTQQSNHLNLMIQLNPVYEIMPLAKPQWKPYESVVNAAKALVSTLQWLVSMLIWIIAYVIPIILIFTIIIHAAKRIIRHTT